jgi:hypothetical protein
MSDKPSYKLARQERKGEGSMEIEPLNPDSAPVVDLTKPVPHTESLVPPEKPGLHTPGISPSPKAGPGWKAEHAPAHPEDWKRPQYSGVVKT